jgi:hypothetical protein
MCDENWDVIKEFENQRRVGDYLGLKDCHKGLNNAIRSKKEYYGYYWRKKEEFEINGGGECY